MTNPWNITPRQAEILQALAEHGERKLIARELGISPMTVKVHVAEAISRMGVGTTVQAAVKWDRWKRSAI